MKHIKFFTIILIFLLPTSLKAQWKRETSFTIGVIYPDYHNNYYHNGITGVSTKLGFYQSWNKPENRFSFRPEVGIDLERLSVDNISSGGLGGGVDYKGTIWSINGELAFLAQIRIAKRLFFSLGPAGKYLFTDITKMTHSWWLMNYGSGTINDDGINRKYLYKPSIGIKGILFETNIGGKIGLGLSVEHQWKGSREDVISYSETNEVSLYFELH